MSPPGSGPRRSVPRLHLVTDDAILARPGFRDTACALLDAGAAAVALHVRGPRTPGRTLFTLCEDLRPRAEAAGALLVVNDRVDVALAAGLDGVHLAGRSLPVGVVRRLLGPDVAVGASVHDSAAAGVAARDGSAWLFVGTLYETPSHPHRPGAGSGAIERAAAVAPVPLLGIGGITVARVAEVLDAGAHGVAVVRGVWDAPDPAGALGDYLVALA